MLDETVGVGATGVGVSQHVRAGLWEAMGSGRAKGKLTHSRPNPDGSVTVLGAEEVFNLITNAGRDFLHVQGYGTSGLGSNGLNYLALSNDTVTETGTSTTLSSEIVANGLSRAQGTVAHTSGTNTTTVSYTFTATGAQAAQKAALFTAASSGTMNHVLAFTQRSLQTGDTLAITFTITLG